MEVARGESGTIKVEVNPINFDEVIEATVREVEPKAKERAITITKNIPAQTSHMDERFGLFVIIVLGEMIFDVSQGLNPITWSLPKIIVIFFGFLVAIGFWWQYFSRLSDNIIHKALRGNKHYLFLSFIYGYSHVFIFMSMVSFLIRLMK